MDPNPPPKGIKTESGSSAASTSSVRQGRTPGGKPVQQLVIKLLPKSEAALRAGPPIDAPELSRRTVQALPHAPVPEQESKKSEAASSHRKRHAEDEKSGDSGTPALRETKGNKRPKAESKAAVRETAVDTDRCRGAGLPGMREITMDEYMDGFPAPSLTLSVLYHICYGDEEDSGGHMYGYGTPEKTKFPPSWDENLIAKACLTVAKYPDFLQRDDGSDTLLCIGEIGGQIVRVFRQGFPDYPITTAYPVRKRG